jgi:hypothetical protein
VSDIGDSQDAENEAQARGNNKKDDGSAQAQEYLAEHTRRVKSGDEIQGSSPY